MPLFPHRSALAAALLASAGFIAVISPLHAAFWKEIPAEDLALTAPTVDPAANVEVLYKEIEIDNSNVDVGYLRTVYVRLKAFTARGVEDLRTVPLMSSDNQRMSGFSARVVKPDGSVAEIDRDGFFDVEVERSRARRIYRKAFAPPNLAVGDIVEYQASFASRGVYKRFRVEFQERWPVRDVTIRIKPVIWPGVRSRTITFKVDKKEENGVNSHGFYVYNLKDIPAGQTEPFQPPQSVVAPWLLFVQVLPGESGKRFWKNYCSKLYKDSDKRIRLTGRIKAKAKELTAGAGSDDEKLRAIYDFCRLQIINSRDPAGQLSPDQRKGIKSSDNPDDVLARGYGNPGNIRYLFASLATAAGFDARTARACDRTEFYFDRKLSNDIAVPDAIVAVKVGGDWRFFNPGLAYYPYGVLPWKNEGVDVVVAERRDALFARTPASPPEFSVEKRTARLSLTEDGTLSGSVVIDLEGHAGIELKEALDAAPLDDQEKMIRDHLEDRIPNGVFSDLEISNVDAQDLPLRIAMTVTVPAYAERLGERLFVQPAFFQRGVRPLFPATDRTHDIVFPFGWTEEDDVELTLPEGYKLDEPSAPRPFEKPPFMKYDVELTFRPTDDGRGVLQSTRRFRCLGSPINMKFYAMIKVMFDEVHRQDQHTLALKRVVN